MSTTSSKIYVEASTQWLAKIMDMFAEETGIFGLNLFRLRNGLSRAETIFWTLCTLFFSCCTIRDLVNASASYLRQDTLTLTSQINNASIVLDPPPTLAFTHGVGNSDFQLRPLSGERLEALVPDFMRYLSSTNMDSTEVDADLFRLTASMLQTMVRREEWTIFPLTVPPSSNLSSWEWASAYRDSENYTLIGLSIEKAYRLYRAANADFSKLARFIAAKICAEAGLLLTLYHYVSKNITFEPCRPANMLMFDANFISFKLTEEAFAFTGPTDYLLVDWNPLTAADGVLLDASGTSLASLAYEADAIGAILSASYNKGGESLVVSLRVSGVFTRTEDRTLEPCSKAVSRYDCREACYALSFVEQCGCFPLRYALAYEAAAGTKVCPYSRETGPQTIDYSACPGTADVNESVLANIACQASTRCAPDCRTRIFVETMERQKRLNSTRNELKLTVRSFTFPLFEEKLALTFDSFISQLGGILGLYIGLSFAALLHVPIFLARMLWRQARTASSSSATVSATTTGSMLGEVTTNSRENAFALSPSISGAIERVLERLDVIDRRLSTLDAQLSL